MTLSPSCKKLRWSHWERCHHSRYSSRWALYSLNTDIEQWPWKWFHCCFISLNPATFLHVFCCSWCQIYSAFWVGVGWLGLPWKILWGLPEWDFYAHLLLDKLKSVGWLMSMWCSVWVMSCSLSLWHQFVMQLMAVKHGSRSSGPQTYHDVLTRWANLMTTTLRNWLWRSMQLTIVYCFWHWQWH